MPYGYWTLLRRNKADIHRSGTATEPIYRLEAITMRKDRKQGVWTCGEAD